jgi:AcrR family transcriptional regulator
MVNINKKIAARRQQQLEDLICTAEKAVELHGLQGLKARELANDIGVSLGAIYNLVEDMDELILLVSSTTLSKLDAVLAPQENTYFTSETEAINRLIEIALLYRKYASEHTNLWRALFEYKMPDHKTMPESLTKQLENLLSHIASPLKVLCPLMNQIDLSLNIRMMFSAVHGIIILGLDKKMVAVPEEAMDSQLKNLVHIMCKGLI